MFLARYHLDKMNKEIARKLLLLVNDPSTFEALNIYLDYQIESIKEQLTNDFNDHPALRAQVHILRKMKNLRIEVNTILKNG